MTTMARDTRKYKANKKQKKKRDRGLSRRSLDHCHSGRRKKEEAVYVWGGGVRVCVRVRVAMI